MGVKHKHSEVIKAWADGAEIQCRTNSKEPWPKWPEGSFAKYGAHTQKFIHPVLATGSANTPAPSTPPVEQFKQPTKPKMRCLN